jgi:hypothetical protein
MNFNILLGDTSELMAEIKESSDFKCVMSNDRRDGWALYKTSHGLYWDIEVSKLKLKLAEQFMIVPNELKVYVCFHFRQKEPLKYIHNIYEMIEADLKGHKKQYIFVGLDFKDHKFQRDIKRDLIIWCLNIVETHGTDYCQYYDLYDLVADW